MKMNRQLINLFFEIKRNLSQHNRNKLKLSDPRIADKLIIVHECTRNERLKYLVERFLEYSDLKYENNLLSINEAAQIKHIQTKAIYEKVGNYR